MRTMINGEEIKNVCIAENGVSGFAKNVQI